MSNKVPVCEMCGRGGNLLTAEIEGVELKVCPNCTKFGKVRHPNSRGPSSSGFKRQTAPSPKDMIEDKVVDNFGQLIREARERKGLTQEDFAKQLQEREGLISKWESGGQKPDLETAKKLQKILGIKLIIKDEVVAEEKLEAAVGGKRVGDVLTLGDFIKVKKRK
jgi:putative transcription factor